MSSRTLPNNVNLSKNADASTNSKVAQSTSDKLEIYADFGVWDTVQNRFLQPGVDFNPGDLFRK